MNPSEYLAQERFDRMYITSSEIAQELSVTRPALHFRRKAGLLPDPIIVPGNQLVIWERETIRPWINKWKEQLASKRKA